jgi:hypothetical protein
MVGGRLCGRYNVEQYCSPQTVLMRDLLELQDWLERSAAPVVVRKTTG